MSQHPLSLDTTVGEHDDSPSANWSRTLSEVDPLWDLQQEHLKKRLAGVLDSLNHREREIIRLRFGLADGYTYKLEEVGHIFQVTRERVRQIELIAMRKLQHAFRAGTWPASSMGWTTRASRRTSRHKINELVGPSPAIGSRSGGTSRGANRAVYR